jgi:hypothetical protein
LLIGTLLGCGDIFFSGMSLIHYLMNGLFGVVCNASVMVVLALGDLMLGVLLLDINLLEIVVPHIIHPWPVV